MIIDYPFLLLALLLLFFPRQWLRFGRAATRPWRRWRRRRGRQTDPAAIREPGDIRLRAAEEFAKPRNYIDLLRAFVGALLLLGNAAWAVEPAVALDPAAVMTGEEAGRLNVWRMVLLLAAVLIQFIRYEGRLTLYAPIFFLAGLGFALCGFYAGLLAVLVAWIMNAALPLTPAGFLTAYSLLLFVLGLLFRGMTDLLVVFAAGVSLLPVLVSLLSRRSLAIFTKRLK